MWTSPQGKRHKPHLFDFLDFFSFYNWITFIVSIRCPRGGMCIRKHIPEDRKISQRRGFCTPRPERFARERSPSCSISQGSRECRCQIFLFPASNLSICVFSKIWSRNGSLIYCGSLKEFKSIFYPSKMRKQYEEGINLYFSLSGLKVAIWSGRQRQIDRNFLFWFIVGSLYFR